MSEIRKGMWITVDGKLAIANHLFRSDLTQKIERVEAHFIDKEGFTILIQEVPAEVCKQAPREMIPESRKMTDQAAKKFGYV